MTNRDMTAVLRDGADIEIVVPNAWVPRLRPRTIRWCRICASDTCALSYHQSVTFTASMIHEDGHWSYTSSERWANAGSRTSHTQPVVVLNIDGVIVSHDHAPSPPPDTWIWNGYLCPMWCRDALGVTQYRIEGGASDG